MIMKTDNLKVIMDRHVQYMWAVQMQSHHVQEANASGADIREIHANGAI